MSQTLVDRLRAELREAMRHRDRELVAALRGTLAAVDNATSQGVVAPRAGAIEASAAGLSAADVSRRQLTDEDIEALVRSEIADRAAAAAELEAAGRDERAQAMRATTDRLWRATRLE